MVYTIGDTAKKLGISASTLRYYDKEGLLPFVDRSNGGIRMFKESDIEWLKIIGCMKKAGMSIKDIKKYIDLSLQGDDTISERLELFRTQREKLQKQMEELQHTLLTVEYKCWYYEKAETYGTTGIMQTMHADEIPEKFRAIREELKNNG
jgi:DNA-binding transcriptional MerR regulator